MSANGINEAELTALFARLGATDPASWARSQVQEGIPQLARFLFLREAWSKIVAEGDVTWIERELVGKAEGPGGGIVPALQRLMAAGASKEDLSTVVRTMQWSLLFELCYQLDGYWDEEGTGVNWRLFQTDDEDNPITLIGGLHESVLETDPTGREMRPPDASGS